MIIPTIDRRVKMVRIAFAIEEDRGLESPIAYHFGRCRYYMFVDVEDSEIKGVRVMENPFFGSHISGAVPQFIADQGARVVIAGGMGPRAMNMLRSLGVEPITGATGRVKDVLRDYLAGRLTSGGPCREPCGPM